MRAEEDERFDGGIQETGNSHFPYSRSRALVSSDASFIVNCTRHSLFLKYFLHHTVKEATAPSGTISRAAANLFPGYFALVMATGIVSIASSMLEMRLVAWMLLVINLVAYPCCNTRHHTGLRQRRRKRLSWPKASV